ncbi:MAG: hypothetical protein J1G06_04490 [Oscillospiraceae bacterium]|nr:hypothetical protein [Oscillospiraceae bacterium]
MKQDELEKVALMMDMLFANNLDDVSGDEYEQYAAAYLLGRLQGRSEIIT